MDKPKGGIVATPPGYDQKQNFAPFPEPAGAIPLPSPPGYIPQGYPQSAFHGDGGEVGDLHKLDDACQDDSFKGMDFSDKTIRRGFLRKVYGLLSVQLLLTMGIISLFMFCDPVKQWTLHHLRTDSMYILYGSMIVAVVCALIMACCEDMRRKAPMNFIFLFVFTVAMSLPLGIATSMMETDVVMMAVGMTASLCFALTLFAMQTKWDFTTLGGILFSFLACLTIFGITALIMPWSKTLHVLYSAVGILLFSFYLVYDTQLMLGGKHKYSISPEEYVFAALNLYLDILNLFVRILRLLR